MPCLALMFQMKMLNPTQHQRAPHPASFCPQLGSPRAGGRTLRSTQQGAARLPGPHPSAIHLQVDVSQETPRATKLAGGNRTRPRPC